MSRLPDYNERQNTPVVTMSAPSIIMILTLRIINISIFILILLVGIHCIKYYFVSITLENYARIRYNVRHITSYFIIKIKTD